MVVGFPQPVQDSGGVKGFNHLGVAFLALLPAPVRAVHVAAHQSATLLIDCRVGRALGRCAKGRQRQRVLRVEHLLQREEITHAVVERTGIHTLVGITGHCRNGHCPAVLVQTRGMSHHAAPAVVTVGIGKTHPCAGCIISSKGLDVVGTANATKTVGILLQTHTDGLVPEGLIHTAGHRVVEREADCIIERNAVDVGLGLLVLVTTDAETGGAEGVTRGLVEGVVCRTAQQRNLLGISLLILKLRL